MDYISEREKYVQRILERAINRDVFIYGAGHIAEEVYFELKKRKIFVKGFFVTSMQKNKKYIDGILVRNILEASQKEKESFFVIATTLDTSNQIVQILNDNKIEQYELPVDNMINLFGMGSKRWERSNLEITTKIGCSINCKYCPQKVLNKAYFERGNNDIYMSLDTFRRCLGKIPQDTIITFSGFCEPFLNSQCINMIDYAVEKGFEITLNTTLIGLDYDTANKLTKYPIKHMILHTPDMLDCANIPISEEYKRILDMLLDAKMSDGRSLIKTANCQSAPTKEVLDIINGRVTFTSEKLQDIAGNINDKEVFMDIDLKGKIECAQSSNLNRNVLLPNGDVVLCCLDYGLKHILGNLLTESYEDIMNGSEISRVRNRMQNGEEVLCRHCCVARQIRNNN